MSDFIVNTNESYRPGAWRDMLNNRLTGKASAYFHRRESVRKILKCDYLYLYQTGVGVIAKGVATSGYKKAECDGVADEEYYVPLKFCWALDESEWEQKAPTAREINQTMGTQHRFRHTVFEITDMAHGIDCIFEGKTGSTVGQ